MAAEKYTREALLKSPEFAGYQRDFLSAVLHEPAYTLAQARRAVKAFFEQKE